MTSKKLYFLLVGALSLVLILLFGIAYLANSSLVSESKKLATAKANAQAVSDQSVQLTRNKNDIAKYSDLNKIAESVVPQDKDQAQAIREIVKIANASGINQLTSITFPASSLGSIGSSAAKAPGGITQVTPVKGISGVYDLQITVVQDTTNKVPYSTFTSFLSNLEKNRRTAQVNSITVQPDNNNPNEVAFTLILDEYIKP
jgi:hypothetical protein